MHCFGNLQKSKEKHSDPIKRLEFQNQSHFEFECDTRDVNQQNRSFSNKVLIHNLYQLTFSNLKSLSKQQSTSFLEPSLTEIYMCIETFKLLLFRNQMNKFIFSALICIIITNFKKSSPKITKKCQKYNYLILAVFYQIGKVKTQACPSKIATQADWTTSLGIISSQSYQLGASASQVSFTAGSLNSTWNNCQYTFSILAYSDAARTIQVTTPSFIAVASQLVSWSQTTSPQWVGTYYLSVIQTSNTDTSGVETQTTNFTFVVNSLCTDHQTETPVINVISSTLDQLYVASTAGSVTITEFTVSSSSVCAATDIVYSISVIPSNAAITYNSATRIVSWSTSLSTCSSYSVTIIGSITNHQPNSPVTYSNTDVFTLYCGCLLSTNPIIISGTSPGPQTYTLGAASQSVTQAAFSENSTPCVATDIGYSMSITSKPSSVSDTSWITFNALTRVVSYVQASSGFDGDYTITITGSITNANGLQTGSINFVLSVVPTCQLSTGAITISGTSPGPQTYTLGAASQSVTQAAFTENSTPCVATDIGYSMSITSKPSSVSDTSWITFNALTRVVSYVQASSGFDGDYTITITGSITNANGLQTGSINFVLSVVPTCQLSTGAITISGTSPGPQTYTLGAASQSVTQAAFTENSTPCVATDIGYSMSITSKPSSVSDTSWITFNALTRVVSYVQASSGFDGDYTITITGTIFNANGPQTGSISFLLTIISNTQCSTSKDTIILSQPAQKPSNQTYLVKDVQTSYIINEFTQSSQYCQSSDISYSMTVTSLTSGVDNSFIVFLNQTLTVTWYTIDENVVGIFSVNITASIRDITSSVSFYLTVNNNVINNSPVLQGMTSTIQDYNIIDITSEVLQLGPIFDQDLDNVTTTYRISSSEGFFNFNTTTGDLTLNRIGLLAKQSSSETKYTIFILLQDNNLSPANSSYVVNIIVPAKENSISSQNKTSSKNETSKVADFIINNVETQNTVQLQDQSEPYWKSITVSDKGEIKITFSKKLRPIYNTTIFKEKSVGFEVSFKPNIENSYKDKISYTWNVTEFTSTYFTIQLNFSDPIYVSCNGKQKLDKVQVIAGDPQNFLTQIDPKKITKSIANFTSLTQFIPVQQVRGQSASATAMIAGAAQATKSVAIGASAANIILGASLNLLWGMVNAIQIISHLPDFSISVPQNAVDFFMFIQELSNFNIVPLDSIYIWLGIEDKADETEQEIPQIVRLLSNKTDDSVQQAPEKSIYMQLGPLFLVLILFGVALGSLILLLILKKFGPCQKFVQSIVNFIYYKLFWNQTLRYIMEAYLNLTLNCVNLLYTVPSLFQSSNMSTQTVFAIITLVVCILSPIFVSFYFMCKIRYFRNEEFLKKFGSVMKVYEFRSKMSGFFFSIFCYRRLVQVILIVCCAKWSWAQVVLMCISCQIVVQIFGHCEIFRLPRDTRLEYFNEVSIMICVYHCFCFTDFVDVQAQQYLGYSFIACTLFNIGVNMIVLLFVTIENFGFMFKKYRFKYKWWKHKRNMLKKQKQRELELEDSGEDDLTDAQFQELQRQKLREQVKKYYDEFEESDSDEEQKKEKARRKELRVLKRQQPGFKKKPCLKVIQEARSDEEKSSYSELLELESPISQPTTYKHITLGNKELDHRTPQHNYVDSLNADHGNIDENDLECQATYYKDKDAQAQFSDIEMQHQSSKNFDFYDIQDNEILQKIQVPNLDLENKAQVLQLLKIESEINQIPEIVFNPINNEKKEQLNSRNSGIVKVKSKRIRTHPYNFINQSKFLVEDIILDSVRKLSPLEEVYLKIKEQREREDIIQELDELEYCTSSMQ